ncbi:hypothetical protein J6590_103815, partial [Homalodisca vitripennis]
CYRCFAYGHVANSPCKNERICRDCGDKFHSSPCQLPLKCIHCLGPHSSNSKYCPEFIRQKQIKERMSLRKEDYFTSSQFYPVTYKNIRGPKRPQTFAEATKSLDSSDTNHYPNLPQISPSNSLISISNRYSSLSTVLDTPTTSGLPSNTVYRKPTSNTNHTSNKTFTTNYKPNSTKPIYANPKPKPNLTETKTVDREHLQALLNTKITEIRNKVKTSNVTTKKQIDELLATFIISNTDTKNSVNTTPKKTYSSTNKNNSTLPPDKV